MDEENNTQAFNFNLFITDVKRFLYVYLMKKSYCFIVVETFLQYYYLAKLTKLREKLL
jgi:hypothetical protein